MANNGGKGYTLGDLSFSLLFNDNSAVSNINSVANSLSKLSKSLKKIESISLTKIKNDLYNIAKIDFTNMVNSLQPLSKLNFSGLNSLNKLNSITNLSKLDFSNMNFSKIKTDIIQLTESLKPLNDLKLSGLNNLTKLSNLNLDKIDFSKLQSQFLQLSNAIDPFLTKLQQAGPALQNFADVLKLQKFADKLTTVNGRLGKINSTASKTNIGLSKVFNLGRIYFWINYTRRAAQAISRIMTSAINFNETLNKFQVSMGSYYERSIKYVNSLTYAFNLSTESIMNYQSSFMNMLSALGGLSSDTSYELSETLTRMAIDYASLFNVSIDRAMEQFQSVLSGQIRSIRTTSGYDVSESTIFSIYQQLGGIKTVRQLDQIEKRLLRILAVQMQMEKTGAFGDFAGTINTASNTLKQLQESLKETGMWIGQLTLVYLEPFLTKVLAVTIALREMIKSLNIMQGYRYDQVRDEANSLFGQVESSAESATEAVEEMKNVLLGFDKLNILGSTGTSGLMPDYKLITDQLLKYSSSLDGVKNKATDLAERILTWLGYTKQVSYYTDSAGNKIEQINWELNEGNTNLEKIKGTLTAIGGIIAAMVIVKTLKNLFFIGKGIYTGIVTIPTIIQTITSAITGTMAAVAGVAAIFAALYLTNEDFRNSINRLIKSVGEVLMPIIKMIASIIEAIMPIINSILNEVAMILVPIIDAISPIISMIGQLLESMVPVIKLLADILSGIIHPIIEAIFFVINPIIAAIQLIVQIVSGALQIALGTIITYVEAILAVWKTIIEVIKTIFSGEWDQLGKKLKDIWADVGKSIKSTFIGVINNIIKAFASFVNSFSSKINDLTGALSGLWEWTGIPAIPKIPRWNPELIPMATGAVVSKPTPALVGEYAGASTNPEIVTPENLMRRVFLESLLPIAQAIVSGDKEVVNAIENLSNRPIQLNGRKVSESIYNDLQNESLRRGTTLGFN